jgi:hypothetical protein
VLRSIDGEGSIASADLAKTVSGINTRMAAYDNTIKNTIKLIVEYIAELTFELKVRPGMSPWTLAWATGFRVSLRTITAHPGLNFLTQSKITALILGGVLPIICRQAFVFVAIVRKIRRFHVSITNLS